MNFRTITAADEEQQKKLLLVALWTPEDQPNYPESVLDEPHIKEFYSQWGKQGDEGIFALDYAGRVIGLAQVRHKSSPTHQYRDYPELAIAVADSHRGQGVAAKLMRELLSRLRLTAPGVRLGVHPQNKAAAALYQKFGFVEYEVASSGFPQMVWHAS